MDKEETFQKSAEALQAPRGTEDVLPGQWTLWRRLEKVAREVFERSGYKEIRTPVFEDTRLFVRGIGETTDIVEKEMYTFADSEDSSITLRPENTAGVMRAYVEYELYKTQRFQKFYYVGPMFRKERPQAGRLRQFHQMGIEAVGSQDPYLDAETIGVAIQLYDALPLKGYEVKLNSIGCEKCRPGYRKVLKDMFVGERKNLCQLCNARLDRNVFRVLDCKQEGCKAIALRMPTIEGYLCLECKGHFRAVMEALSTINIPFDVDPHLVRGLDYYTKTVYEIIHPALGARNAVCAGGRYDGLISDIGGPPIPAVGFALGVEASILALERTLGVEEVNSLAIDAFIISIGEETRKECFRLLNKLRGAGVSADIDYEGKSTKAQMRTANKLGAKNVLVIGPEELAKGMVKIKDMGTGEEKFLKEEEVITFLSKK